MKALKKLSNGIRDYLNRPKPRCVYAVTRGDHLGSFFVYIERKGDIYWFLSLPDMKVESIPAKHVLDGIRSGILDRVERLPSDVYKLCQQQYIEGTTTHGTDDNVPSKALSDT